MTCRLPNFRTMAKGIIVPAGTWHGSRGMVLLVRTINAVDLRQTVRDLLRLDPSATLTLEPTAMMQMLVVPFLETGYSLNERGSVTETEIVTATEIETGTVTGTVIDGLTSVAMIVPE